MATPKPTPEEAPKEPAPRITATRASLLGACTTLKEEPRAIPGAGDVILRELTAQERLNVSEAARDAGAFDAALFNAIIMQQGTWDTEGQARLLTPEDIPTLIGGRGGLVAAVANAIWALSEASLDSLKSGDLPPDAG